MEGYLLRPEGQATWSELALGQWRQFLRKLPIRELGNDVYQIFDSEAERSEKVASLDEEILNTVFDADYVTLRSGEIEIATEFTSSHPERLANFIRTFMAAWNCRLSGPSPASESMTADEFLAEYRLISGEPAR
jgi:hypothetical protein